MKCREKLDILLKLSDVISNEQNLDKLINSLATITQEVTEGDRCSIYIYNRKRELLWSKVAQKIERVIKVPIGEGIVGEVAKSKRAQIVDDAYLSKHFFKSVDLSTGYRTKEVIAVPIINKKDKCIGVIQVLNKSGGFSRADLKSLNLIANYIASSLENALLHKSLRRKIELELKRSKEKDLIIFEQSRITDMGEMINAIAHNWRQPLNVISITVNDILDAYEYGELDLDYLKESVEKTNQTLEQMSQTINDFRTLFKSNGVKEKFFVNEIILNAIRLISKQYQSLGINIVVKNIDKY